MVDLVVVEVDHDALVELDQFLIVGKADRGNLGDRPRHEAGLAVLAENVGVHVLLGNGQILGDAGAQTRGVQQRAGADDAVLRNAGNLAENVGQNVDRVGDDDIGRVRAGADDLGGNLLDDVYVGLRKVDARLAGLRATPEVMTTMSLPTADL